MTEEKMYTPQELAKAWNLSENTIRNWFREEEGVLVFGRKESKPGRKRAHLTQRIPASVAERVRTRMSNY